MTSNTNAQHQADNTSESAHSEQHQASNKDNATLC